MQRLLLPCLLIFVLLSGCASLQAKKEVIDNTFYSPSNPKIQIRVNPEFKYIGEAKKTFDRDSVSGSTKLKHRRRWYAFIDSDDSMAKKGVAIKVERVETQFISDLYSWIKNYYEKGTCKLGDRNFQFCSYLVYPSMSSALTKFVTDEGYVLPKCVLTKSFSKVFGTKGDILVVIYYMEDIPNLPYDCKAWKPEYPLAEEQRAYLEQFNKNSDKAFEVLQ